eukprot:9312678-Alexandrium_andersonii.AAC.1
MCIRDRNVEHAAKVREEDDERRALEARVRIRADEQREGQQQALAEESARRMGEVMEEMRQ